MKNKNQKSNKQKTSSENAPMPKLSSNKYIRWYQLRKHKKKMQQPQTFQEKAVSFVKTVLGAFIVVMILNGLAIASFVVPTGSMEKTVMTGDFLFVNKFIYGPSTPQVIPFLDIPLPFYRFPGFKDPEKGDVIVFIYPGDRDEVEARDFQYYLKRCVAVQGDTLQIIDKRLFINGKEIPMTEYAQYDYSVPSSPYDQWQTFPAGRGYTRDNYGPIRIPKEGDTLYLNKDNWREWEFFIKREKHTIGFDGINVLIDGKSQNYYIVERNYCFGLGDNRDHSLDSRYWGFIPVENVVGTPIIVYWSWDTNAPLVNIVDKISSIRLSRVGKIIR